MKYLAVDFGAKKLGLAVCDQSEILVSPLLSLERRGVRSDAARILEIVRAQQVEGMVFGVPRALEEGQIGSSEPAARAFAQSVRETVEKELPQVLFFEQDERFSTALALRQGRESGLSHKKGRASDGASSIDARAAGNILQAFLDAKSASRPGDRAHDDDASEHFEGG